MQTIEGQTIEKLSAKLRVSLLFVTHKFIRFVAGLLIAGKGLVTY